MQELPSRLWHYTSPTGALGILQSRAIRATMIHYLNDARELTYALDLAKEVLQEESGKEDGDAGQECRDFLDRIRKMAVYVASFSTKEDDLSQWRAYCPAEGGHAICFEAPGLRSVAEPAGYQLLPCLYARDQQLEMLRPIIRRMLRDPNARRSQDLYDAYALEVAVCGAQLKHEAFSGEHEWRLVGGPAPECESLQYRDNGALIIPFRSLSLAANPYLGIVEIMIGPHRHPELAARSLRMLTTRDFGWPARITHSKAPFRSLS